MKNLQITHDERSYLLRLFHWRLDRMNAILTSIARAIEAGPSQARRYMLKARRERVLDLHQQTRDLHALLISAEFQPFIAPQRKPRAPIYG